MTYGARAVPSHLLNKIDIVESTMDELCTTSWEGQELTGHGIGVLYPSGSGTRQVGGSSGQCLSLCSKCFVLCNCFNAFTLSKQAPLSRQDGRQNEGLPIEVMV
ncbi:hypothetical protein AKJ16_DCAP16928 [Drosera capensis]